MKSLVLTAAVAAMGFAGMTTEASADHRRGNRGGFDLRIGGDRFGIAISTGRQFGARRGIVGSRRGWIGDRRGFIGSRRGFVPGPPVIVAPARRYCVRYYMYGTRRVHLECPRAARRYEQRLESLGFDVRVVRGFDHYDVLYRLRGSRTRTFSCPRAARAFERQVEDLGARARVLIH